MPQRSSTTHVPHPQRWLILAAMILTSIMGPLDSSALNVAIYSIQRDFHAPLSMVAWVPLIYLVVLASLMLPCARLGDVYGFRPLFLGGAMVFILASLLCGFAPSLPVLIALRVLQGVGACLTMSIGPGLATAIFPAQERGRALGFIGMGIALGLVLGPSVGGVLTQWQSWRWIFFVNIPIGLAGVIWSWRLLPRFSPSAPRIIDWLGALLAGVMLGAILLAGTQGHEWGWTSPQTLILLALGIVAGAAFFRHERRHVAPMLDLSLFRNAVFTGANLAAMMNYLGLFCAIFLTPLLLQQAFGYSPREVGMMMVALPLSMLVLAPISGALSDKIGSRPLAIVGELLVTAGLLALALVMPLGERTPYIVALVLIGIGSGIFQSPNNSAIMGSVPRSHLGIGGGVMATMRNLGMAMGIALSSTVTIVAQSAYLARHPGATVPALIHGVQWGFFIGAAFALLGAITSAVRQDKLREQG